MAGSVEVLWSEWQIIAAILLTLSSVIAAIVYLIGSLLSNDKIKAWVRMEIFEIVFSLILIAILIPLISSLDSVGTYLFTLSGTNPGPLGTPTSTWVYVSSASGSKYWEQADICSDSVLGTSKYSPYYGVGSCPIRLGIWYMRELFWEAKNLAYDIYVDYTWKQMIADLGISVQFSLSDRAGVGNLNPFAGFVTVGNSIRSQVFNWISKVMLLMKFQEVFLRFISVALFPVLLVIGIVLRSFAFTRRLGGLLMALALSLYYIYPAFYAMAALLVLDMKNDPFIVAQWESDVSEELRELYGKNPPVFNQVFLSAEYPSIAGKFDSLEARRALSDIESRADSEQKDILESGSAIPNIFSLRTSISESQALEENNEFYSRVYSWYETLSKIGKKEKLDSVYGDQGIVASAARLTFWSFFFSFVSIIATIAAARSLSMTFGGDLEIAGLTRLI